MNLTIRPEEKSDFREVEELTREAFWNLYLPGCNEHYLAHELRKHPDFIKELDVVAEVDGRIVGNIMYTRAWLLNERGETLDIVSFGPLSVLPGYQRRGIGSALIRHTTEIAAKMGIKTVVIFGDPHNYCKHGFRNGKDLQISDPNGDYPFGLLALEMEPGSIEGCKWKYKQSEAYNIDEKAVEEFDRTFEPKEKGYNYSQEIFSIAFRSFLK